MRIIGKIEPDWNEPLWRYFNTDRFVSFADTGSLYFASARQFEDRFEGAVAVMPPGFPVDPRYAELDRGEPHDHPHAHRQQAHHLLGAAELDVITDFREFRTRVHATDAERNIAYAGHVGFLPQSEVDHQ